MLTSARLGSKTMTASRLLTVIAITALVLSACGGGSDAEPTATSARPSATTAGPTGGGSNPTTSPGGDEDPQPVEFATGEEVYHSGFRVEVVGGTIVSETQGFSSDVRYTLILDLNVENLGSDAAFFGPSATVVSNTGTYTWDSGFSLADDVPGGLSSVFEIKLRVDEGFDPSSATLIIGDADENRAVAPLGPGGDTAVRLEPAELTTAGAINLELIDVIVTSADLRYDNVQRHRQIESGKRALTLHFDIVSRAQGNWSIFETDLALVRPDGTIIAPDGAELDNIAGAEGGVTTEGLSVRFLVDEDASGDHTLRFTPGSWFVGDDEVTEGEFSFTLS